MMKTRVIAAGLMSLALIASACAKPATPAPTPVKAPPVATPAPATPAPGRVVARPTPLPAAPAPAVGPTGELRVAVGYVGTETLDPIAGPQSGVKFLAEQVYDFLVGVDQEGKLSTETGLAYKWEMTPDAKKWTFYMRKGVKFHNGDEVTAEDVKFSIERVMSPVSRSTNASSFRKWVERMEVPDPYTIVFHLTMPTPLLSYSLSPLIGVEGMVVPKKYIQQVGEDEFGVNPVGSGPYKFAGQVFGSYIKYEALDKHWRLGVPQFKTITLLSIPEIATRVAALKTGQADIIEAERETVPELKAAGFQIVERPFTTDIWVKFLQQWEDVAIADKRVRLALVMAVNRQEIIDNLLMGMGVVTPLAWHTPIVIGYEKLEPYPFDPERAKQLLAEAGYPGGQGLKLDVYAFTRPGVPENPKISEAMAGYWDKIGIKTKIIPTDYGAYRALWRGKKIPGATSTMGVEPRLWMQPLIMRFFNKPDKFALTDRPDIYELTLKAGAAIDDEEREELMRQVYRATYEDVIWSNIGSVSKVYALRDTVASYAPRPVAYSLSLDTVVRAR